MSDSSERAIYRVKSINPGANTKKTTWVRAPSSQKAVLHVERTKRHHYVDSVLEWDSIPDAEVVDVP